MVAKKTLTLDDIRSSKKAPRRTVEITLDGEGTNKKTVEFVFRGIGRKAFEELAEQYPSADNPNEWDPARFGPALVAAACEAPKMTEAEAKAIWDDPEWSYQECDQLFAGALSVNAGFRLR